MKGVSVKALRITRGKIGYTGMGIHSRGMSPKAYLAYLVGLRGEIDTFLRPRLSVLEINYY